jgi:hypothetical protein
MPAASVISDRSPFYGENAPVGAPRAGDDPAPGTTELLREGGGCQGGGWGLMGGGGLGGKTHVLLEPTPLWEKIHRAVTFDPTHISSLDSCIP